MLYEVITKKYGDRIITIEDGKITEDKKAVETDDNSLDEFELKKSKLPFSYALKMAVNSLKVRPLKLIMTIILTTISLIFMGITVNCALFDSSFVITSYSIHYTKLYDDQ